MPVTRDDHALALERTIDQLGKVVPGFRYTVLAHLAKIAIIWLYCKRHYGGLERLRVLLIILLDDIDEFHI